MATRYSSHAVARLADLVLVPVRQPQVVRQRGPYLEIGPQASGDVIVTVACRRLLALEGARCTERALRERVRSFGYAYAVAPAIVKTRTPSRRGDIANQRVGKATHAQRAG